jgi:uncharacterized membrane protein YgcG
MKKLFILAAVLNLSVSTILAADEDLPPLHKVAYRQCHKAQIFGGATEPKKKDIIDIFLKVENAAHRENYIKIAGELLKNDIVTFGEKVGAIELLVTVPHERLEAISSDVLKLVMASKGIRKTFGYLKSLKHLEDPDRTSLADVFLRVLENVDFSLMTKKVTLVENNVLEAIRKIDIVKRDIIIDTMMPFLKTDSATSQGFRDLLLAVDYIYGKYAHTPDFMASLFAFAAQFISDEHHPYEQRALILRNADKIRLDSRDTFLSTIKPIIMSPERGGSFFAKLASLQTADVLTNALERTDRIFTKKENLFEYGTLVKTVSTITSKKWDECLPIAEEFFPLSDNGIFRSALLIAINRIPVVEREVFSEQMKILIQGTSHPLQLVNMFRHFSKMKADERGDFVAQMQRAISHGTTPYEVFHSLLLLSPELRSKAVEAINTLIVPNKEGFSYREAAKMLSSIIDDENRKHIIKYVNGTTTPFTSARKVLDVIGVISNMSIDERRDVFRSVLRLLPQGWKANPIFNRGKTLFHMIVNIRYTPDAEREARVERVRAHINLPIHHPMYEQRFRMIMELPLDAPIPALNADMAQIVGQNGYAYGVNVHTGSREERTTHAYRLFINHMKEACRGKSTDTLKKLFTESFNDFISYKDTKLTPEKLERVNRVLMGDPSGSNSYGGLFQGKVTSCGLNMMGKGLIAYLWYYISSYVDPYARGDEALIERDRESARIGMMNALAQAIEINNGVVCNVGKLQHMATAVLQGRLPGVNIDGIEMPAEGAAPAVIVLTPEEITNRCRGAWDAYKATLPQGTVINAEILDTFSARYKAENPTQAIEIIDAIIEALKDLDIPDPAAQPYMEGIDPEDIEPETEKKVAVAAEPLAGAGSGGGSSAGGAGGGGSGGGSSAGGSGGGGGSSAGGAGSGAASGYFVVDDDDDDVKASGSKKRQRC